MQEDNRQWQGRTDGGNFGLKFLLWILKYIPLCIAYSFVALALPFYLLCRPKSRNAIYSYFHKQLSYPKGKAVFYTWAQHFVFGQILMDKLAVLSNKNIKFSFASEGVEEFYKLLEKKEGYMLFGAHVGNFEIAGYLLKQDVKRINSIAFGGEEEILQQYRKRKFKETNVRVLTVTDDMSHLFSLNSAIDNGEIISLTCDRSAGSEKSIKCNFLGEPAKFPVGPFALAITKNVEVLSLFIMKEKRKNYRIFVKNITVHQENINKKEKIQQLATNYIKELEKVVKLYPTQWFNFYDFWKN